MRRRSLRRLLVASLVLMTVPLPVQDAGAASVAGSQGTDTSLPLTDSAVTVRGRGEFASLEVTVNQTRNLINQAVSITWRGGEPTVSSPGRFGTDFLQIMQCWGEDDGSVPANPGPPPEQCVQGASGGVFGGVASSSLPNGLSGTRVVSRTNWDNFDPTVGVVDPKSVNVFRPFRAVDGTVVEIPVDNDFNPSVVGGQYWLNPFFNIITTNEIPAALTRPDGTGSELFEAQTGLQSSGLGCGQRSQPVAGGTKKIPRCWLVVVPRGDAVTENAGTPFGGPFAAQNGVSTSPLAPAAWANRIAIELDFNPVESPCELGADERRISGNELALAAVSNWQPALCAGAGLPPFSYAPTGDASARQQLTSTLPGGPGMVVINKPLPVAANTPASPIVYAPLAVSGLVIGFNVERNPRPDAPPEAQSIAGVRIAEMNLTPRLVAKLLTQSYRSAVNFVGSPDYPWMRANPAHLGLDPDFRQFNPEFSQLQLADSRTFSGLQVPQGSSDAAEQIWAWVLADPEAAAWLAGEPDQWGMNVNPVYSTDPDVNPTGRSFLDPTPVVFPKAEPYCFQAPNIGLNGDIKPAPLCGTDWMPYARGYNDTARIARIAFDGARIVLNQQALSPSTAWGRDIPQTLGSRGMLALTDTPSAQQFGLQVARLSRAGDNGLDRAFLAPDTAALSAGVAAMRPTEEPNVLGPDPTVDAPGAYPLTTVTYAAIAPLKLDQEARADYAAFLEFARTEGQQPGVAFGELPPGYAPLPSALVDQAATAAEQVLTVTSPPPAPPTTVVSIAPPTTVGTVSRPVTGSGSVTRPRTPTPTQPPVSAPPPVEPTDSVVVEDTVPTTDDAPAPGEEQQGGASAPPASTPLVKIAGTRMAIPLFGAVALVAALGAMEITKRPRRRAAKGVIPLEAAEAGV